MSLPAHPFAVLADPVRRRLVEILAVGEHSAGTLGDVVSLEHGVSRSAVSHHLRTLRDHGAVTSAVDPVEPRSRSYRLSHEFLMALDDEVERLFRLWDHRYGTVERRAPLVDPPRSRESPPHRFARAAERRAPLVDRPRSSESPPHRFGAAAERRAEQRSAEWGRRPRAAIDAVE